MADPVSTIILAGAAGGAAGKFMEKSYDSAGRWLSSFFKDHQESIQKNANDNAEVFLNNLVLKIQRLETDCGVNSDIINAALEDPHFSALFQKSLIASSQTRCPLKSDILAQLVSQRMKAAPESLYSIASPAACDAVSKLTPGQLSALGFLATLYWVLPIGVSLMDFKDRAAYVEYCSDWLEKTLTPFLEVKVWADPLKVDTGERFR